MALGRNLAYESEDLKYRSSFTPGFVWPFSSLIRHDSVRRGISDRETSTITGARRIRTLSPPPSEPVPPVNQGTRFSPACQLDSHGAYLELHPFPFARFPYWFRGKVNSSLVPPYMSPSLLVVAKGKTAVAQASPLEPFLPLVAERLLSFTFAFFSGFESIPFVSLILMLLSNFEE